MTRIQPTLLLAQLHKFLLPIALLPLCACSTLRVDVDVYKGPLINEKTVQDSQMAGLAIGAKTMLRQVHMSLRHNGSPNTPPCPELQLTATFIEEILSSYEDNKLVRIELNRLRDSSSTAEAATALKNIHSLADSQSPAYYTARTIELRLAEVLHDEIKQEALTEMCGAADKPSYCTYKEGCWSIQHTNEGKDALAEKIGKGGAQIFQNTSFGEKTIKGIQNIAESMQANSGLDRLIADCATTVNSENNIRCNEDEFRKELAVFAERVRVLGNSAKFMLPLLESKTEPNMVDESASTKKDILALHTYAPVLQTVGNSILSMVNERVRAKNMEERIRNGLEAENAGNFEQALWRTARYRLEMDIRKKFDDRAKSEWAEEERWGEIAAALGNFEQAINTFSKTAAAYRIDTQDIQPTKRAQNLIHKCAGKGKTGSELLKECMPDDKLARNSAEKLLEQNEKKTSGGIDKSKLVERIQEKFRLLSKKQADADLLEGWIQRLSASEFNLVFPNDTATKIKPSHVMDIMLANLHQQKMKAILQYGKNSSESQRLEDAIQLVTAYRATMIPLIPASAYLRNSHPATAIDQGTDQRDEKNFLSDGLKDMNPFKSRKLTGQDAVRQELDQQYWQPVNKVHVSGGGKTNQVIAKDDVGNWYVKQYDSDKKAIFDSMRGLALYNLRGKYPALQKAKLALSKDQNLSYGSITLKALGADGTNAKPEIPAPGTLSAAYRAILADYADKVMALYKKTICLPKREGLDNDDANKKISGFSTIHEACADVKLSQLEQKKSDAINKGTLSNLEKELLDAFSTLDMGCTKYSSTGNATEQNNKWNSACSNFKSEGVTGYFKLLEELNKSMTTLSLGLTPQTPDNITRDVK